MSPPGSRLRREVTIVRAVRRCAGEGEPPSSPRFGYSPNASSSAIAACRPSVWLLSGPACGFRLSPVMTASARTAPSAAAQVGVGLQTHPGVETAGALHLCSRNPTRRRGLDRGGRSATWRGERVPSSPSRWQNRSAFQAGDQRTHQPLEAHGLGLLTARLVNAFAMKPMASSWASRTAAQSSGLQAVVAHDAGRDGLGRANGGHAVAGAVSRTVWARLVDGVALSERSASTAAILPLCAPRARSTAPFPALGSMRSKPAPESRLPPLRLRRRSA
jgi:hypothetical protein